MTSSSSVSKKLITEPKCRTGATASTSGFVRKRKEKNKKETKIGREVIALSQRKRDFRRNI